MFKTVSQMNLGKIKKMQFVRIIFMLCHLATCVVEKCVRSLLHRLSNSETSTKYSLTRASQTLQCIGVILGFC